MIVCIYNRAFDFEILFGSHMFQRKIIETCIVSVTIFKKSSDDVVR